MAQAATVVHIITQLELGGAQEITLFSCRHLNRTRFRVHLISGPGGLLDREASEIPDLSVHFENHLIREVRPASDFRCFRSLARRLREIKRAAPGPLIVHTHSSKAGILGRWAAYAARADVVVHTIHGFGFHDGQPWPVRRTFQAVERWTARVTNGFVADSEANLEVARQIGLLARRQPAVALPCWIDPGDYEPRAGDASSLRAELGVDADTPLVGMIACLKPQKAPVDFVRIAARVAAIEAKPRFFLAGDGVLRPEVEQEIQKLGLGARFKLLGWRRDVRRLLAATDILVLTSLWEGMPRVIPQAMAARKPVVASAVDGVPEAVDHDRSGFVVAPHDLDGFAAQIRRLLADPQAARAMGEVGYQRLEAFNAWSQLARLEALYDELLERRACSSPCA